MVTNVDAIFKVQGSDTTGTRFDLSFKIPETAQVARFPRVSVAASASNTAISLPEDYSASTYDDIIFIFHDPNDTDDLTIKVSGTSNQARSVKPFHVMTDKPSSIHVSNADASNTNYLDIYVVINTA